MTPPLDRDTLMIALGLGAAALLGLGLALDRVTARRRRFEARLGRIGPRDGGAAVDAGAGPPRRSLAAALAPLLDGAARALFARERDRAEMRRLLWAAGYRAEGALTALAAAKLAGLALGGAAAWFLMTGGDAGAPFGLMEGAMTAGGGVAGAILPEMILRSRRDARRRRLRDALPDAIDLMVIAAYAGQSLDMALERVAREMRGFAPEIAEELTTVSAEMQALPDRSEALRGFGERTDLREARAFALTLIQTIRYGSPFTESLKALGHDLRQARMIALEERGAKLPALLTLPLIVFIMPAVFVVVVGPAAIAVVELFGS